MLQGQAFGGRYSNVKIVNYGTVKRTWRFTTGAYTTTLRNCKGNFEECIGLSTGNGVTTISFENHDGNQLSTIYTNLITVIGGAWQGVGTTKFKFRFGTDFWLKTDVEGNGVFLDVDSSANGVYSRCQLQGFSGTYMVGAPAASSILLDQQVNYNTYPFNLTWGYFQFNSQGVATRSSLHSGASDRELLSGDRTDQPRADARGGGGDKRLCARQLARRRHRRQLVERSKSLPHGRVDPDGQDHA